MTFKNFRFLILFLLMFQNVSAQENNAVNWLTFAQLDDSLSMKPKKVFIYFFTDWCTYCKKMDRTAFRDPSVISKLNAEYYAVKMDAEMTDRIAFGGGIYVNKEIGRKRNPTHEIALLLASRKDHPFSLPAFVFLNEGFKVTERYFEYLSPIVLNRILVKRKNNH